MKITASLKNSTLYKECGIALTTWLLLFSFLLFQQPRSELTGYVALVFPYAIVFYWFCYAKLIPGIIRKQQDYRIYLLKVILTIALTALPIIAATSKLATGLYLFAGIFTLAFQLVFTAPIAWEVYHYRLRTGKEINRLKIALGRSDANFQFLQSQINPHFLFNALNTLLGTAMQEKAERTGEGIQMLGDMMRFLLHEQGKEFIPLKHEIDYLHRFIALQKLRIRRSPNILIEIMIEEPPEELEILPMLVIPFIENAFKHGISLRLPSRISISLKTEAQTLYLHVSNTIHTKKTNDLEKEIGGIGLKNVRQRLKLIYPQQHKLVTGEMENIFFVNLQIQLTKIT
ncbi:sensor histidine kinase [Mucilaginibacter paludis]|uniref:Signal transduction histidine kinase n=1 Tax=Mucilaginibacter paludis DSM 18603 TaxID=714943 RepID=H1YAD5_9SPHI|nr:sensor histidine kinase [Mucilaginibacter paludis]EHQ26978.1 putative signal transduction histidine kinase [Mucilaginibacter paludis DSM 18603]